MKKQTGIWIDSTKAVVINFVGGKESIVEIEGNIDNKVHHESEGNKGDFMGDRHINPEKKYDERKKNQIDVYLKEVIDVVKDSDELLVFGPAEIKLKLKDKIESDKNLAFKLKAVKVSDSMSQNQMVEIVRNFYSI